VAFSPVAAFVASGLLCLISLVSLLLVASPPRQPRPTASRWALIAEGLNYVWTTKVVLGAISLDLFAVLLGGVTALLPVYARDILHVGPQGFGILRAAPSAGAIVTGFVLAARPLKSRAGLKMFAAVGIYGLSTLVFALSRSMVLSTLALALLGAADMVSVFVRQTLVQIVTPDPCADASRRCRASSSARPTNWANSNPAAWRACLALSARRFSAAAAPSW
jgi:Transmembrane secretion effector